MKTMFLNLKLFCPIRILPAQIVANLALINFNNNTTNFIFRKMKNAMQFEKILMYNKYS